MLDEESAECRLGLVGEVRYTGRQAVCHSRTMRIQLTHAERVMVRRGLAPTPVARVQSARGGYPPGVGPPSPLRSATGSTWMRRSTSSSSGIGGQPVHLYLTHSTSGMNSEMLMTSTHTAERWRERRSLRRARVHFKSY